MLRAACPVGSCRIVHGRYNVLNAALWWLPWHHHASHDHPYHYVSELQCSSNTHDFMSCQNGASSCYLCLAWPSRCQAGKLGILRSFCDQGCDMQMPSDAAATGLNQYSHADAGLAVSPSLHPFPPHPLLTCSQPPCQPFWLSHITSLPHKLQLIVLLNLLCGGLLCPGHSVDQGI